MNTELDKNRIPQHIAIIMDGNGRWATDRGLDRTFGHKAGLDTVKKITAECARLGVKYLTLYTFSTENWNRPEYEVAALMELMFNNIDEEVFIKNHVRLRVVGDLERIPAKVLAKINHCIDNTKEFDRACMVIALSYSSRWEIARAARILADKAAKGDINPSEINEQTVSDAMTTNFMPDPELLIRTGGELRLSNFLLWQAAYTELYFCDTYWPDFNMEELCKAIYTYQQRERRFGKTGAQVAEQKQNKAE